MSLSKYFVILIMLGPSFGIARPIDFSHQVATCISADLIWAELREVMVNSEESWLWPHEESLVEGRGLSNGSRIEVTYGTGWFSPTYGYVLEDVIEGQSLTYLADSEHPFDGGATISLEKRLDVTVIDWQGVYRNASSWQRNYFNRFARRFFDRLDEKVKIAEPELCKQGES